MTELMIVRVSDSCIKKAAVIFFLHRLRHLIFEQRYRKKYQSRHRGKIVSYFLTVFRKDFV